MLIYELVKVINFLIFMIVCLCKKIEISGFKEFKICLFCDLEIYY